MALAGLLSGSSNAVMSISTTLGGDKLLVLRTEGREALGQLPEYRIDLVGNTNLLGMREHIRLHSLLGTRACVTIDVHRSKRHINGFVTRMERGERHGRYEAFSMVMRPWLWFATRTRNSRVFQNKSVKDIVTAVLNTYSADFAWRLLVPALYHELEYCVQYDETDFDFVSRLLEDAGIYYFFEHTSTTHTMVLVDSMAKHRSKSSSSPIEWANSLKHDSTIINWHAQEEVRSVKVTLRDHDYLATNTQVEAHKSALPTAATSKLGDAEVYEFPAKVVQNQVRAQSQPATAAATQHARVRLEEQQSLQTTHTGTTNTVDVAVGATFLLEKPSSPTESVNYLVVAMNFRAEYADHEAIEDLKSIKRKRDGFVADIVAINMTDGVFRPERRTARPVMYGPQTATVVGASGNEIETDPHGRIKIQFHWDREGEKNQNSSCWVRAAQPWAGKGMGLWSLPRIGHEVVVSFLGGDPDRPLVTGSVHNDINPPIYELPKLAHVSGWRTHSTKEGGADMYHELRFADEKTKEYVWLQSQRDYYRNIKENAFDLVGKNETIKVKQTRKEVLGENWYMNVGQDVAHEYGKDWHAKVAGDVFLTGNATYQLQLAKDISVKGGADAGFDITGKTAWKSGGDYNVQTDGAANLKATGNLVQEAGQKLSLKATGDLVMEGMSVKIKADGQLVIEAPGGITLVCGGSSIALTSSSVDIAGGMVNINCGGGGGSAGSAESAAAAEPKAPAEAKTQEDLRSDKAEDYDKQFQDPIAAGDSTGGSGA